MADVIEITDPGEIDQLFRVLDGAATSALNNNKSLFVKYGTDKGMTGAQRGALHVWCDQVANFLNDAGQTCYILALKEGDPDIEIDWTMSMIKDMQFKRVLKVMTGKDSTEQQTTIDPSLVANTIIRAYSERGLSLPAWPSSKG